MLVFPRVILMTIKSIQTKAKQAPSDGTVGRAD